MTITNDLWDGGCGTVEGGSPDWVLRLLCIAIGILLFVAWWVSR